MTDSLAIERHADVAWLWLDRAARHNAFDDALIAALDGALATLEADAGVRAVVLAGRGVSFSAGADLGWMQRMAGADEACNRADAEALARMLRRLDRLPCPTLARVQGAAYGGGVGLIACCDIAIGTPVARFALSEARLGLLPAVISPYVIAAIGPRQARRWFATGEAFDAATAQRIGLLHEVVEADALDAAVQRQLDLVLGNGPHASRAAKTLVRDVLATPEPDRQDAANAALIARLRTSDEGREGVSAFLDKRAPRWRPD
jgi:methylglutaconyl-CoA hydratase